MSMETEAPKKNYGFVIAMRAATARVIEHFLVDYPYALREEMPKAAPTDEQVALAKAIDHGMRPSRTRAHIVLADEGKLLDTFVEQVELLIFDRHPVQLDPADRSDLLSETMKRGLRAVVSDVKAKRSISVVDKMVKTVGRHVER